VSVTFGRASPASGLVKADDLFRSAAAMVREGREHEALPLLEAGVHDHPGDARLWQLLGLANRNLEELEPALEALHKAASLAPADPLTAHTLARAAMEAGLPATALFERAGELAPMDGTVMLGHAATLHAEGRVNEAIAYLEDRLAHYPDWLPGHGALSKMRWTQGQGTESVASFRRALAGLPGEVGLWREFINFWMEGERYEEALEAIAQARAAAGDNPMFSAMEAACRAELGQTEAADALFERMGSLHIALAVHKVRNLIRSGRVAEAAALAESHKGQPGYEGLLPYVSLTWRLLKDHRWGWLEADPSLVGVYDIADAVGPLDALADRLRTLHRAKHQPLEQSLRGGTQTDGPLVARIDPEIRRLRAAIRDAVETHIAQLAPVDPRHPVLGRDRAAPVRFAGSWSVRLTGGGHHANHVHPAGRFSSAFYVALPESGMGGDGKAGWLTLGEAPELGVDLPPIRTIEPKPGRLVLFPSTMWHGTRKFPAGERLTVAFDVAQPLS
jgi:Flp pilus assembly protein TadD